MFMLKEKKIEDFFREAGFDAVENECILVRYAPENLSDAVVKFFWNKWLVLQVCKDSLVFADMKADGLWALALDKEDILEIPFSEIRKIDLEEAGFNYHLTIETEQDSLRFSIQQGELSNWRSTGMITTTWGLDKNNWHKHNMDRTLAVFKELKAKLTCNLNSDQVAL